MAVIGTQLLSYVVNRAGALGRNIYIAFSHLAKDAAESACRASGVQLEPVGEERLVPFRVRAAWEKLPNYYRNLIDMEGGLIQRANRRYRYWHRLRTYRVLP